MECCIDVSTETVLQIDKFYTVVRRIFEVTFRTVVLRRSEWMREKYFVLLFFQQHSSYVCSVISINNELVIQWYWTLANLLQRRNTVRNVSSKILLITTYNLSICKTDYLLRSTMENAY